MNRDRKCMGIGGVGAGIMVLCCFTPLLVVSLGVFGLSALVGWWLDLILFPALGFFVALLGYGMYLRQRKAADRKPAHTGEGQA